MEIEPVTPDEEIGDDERMNQLMRAMENRERLRQPSQEDPQ